MIRTFETVILSRGCISVSITKKIEEEFNFKKCSLCTETSKYGERICFVEQEFSNISELKSCFDAYVACYKSRGFK